MKFLFVGGPADGTWREVAPEALTTNVIDNAEPPPTEPVAGGLRANRVHDHAYLKIEPTKGAPFFMITNMTPIAACARAGELLAEQAGRSEGPRN